MALEGKGFYIWKINMCEGGDVNAILRRAQDAGLSHVLIKIADGASAYNVDLAAPLVEALKGSGIQAWGWQFAYGNSPFEEADIAVHRIGTLGIDGFVINAESAYKRKNQAASAYVERLKAGIPAGFPLALSSFRFPTYHPDFPWTEFLSGVDINMPQVYWLQASNPAQQTDRCIAEFQNTFPVKPIIPTGAAYAEWGWRPTTGQLQEFLSHAKGLGLTAANFWSWDYAGSAEGRDLWDVIANFDWPVSTPAPDLTDTLLTALNARDVDALVALYQPNAVLVTASRTYQGPQQIRAYYQDLLTTQLPGATFSLETRVIQDNIRHTKWDATGATNGNSVNNAQDTLGSRQGLIQYHASIYKVTAG